MRNSLRKRNHKARDNLTEPVQIMLSEAYKDADTVFHIIARFRELFSFCRTMLIIDSDITPEWLLIWHGTAV